jgi:hypothetical protein
MRTHTSQTYATARQRGAALIIVLAFVVLLTGLTFAYFSRSATDRQLSRASYNDAAADILARSALDIVVGDFRQEIINGSTSVTVNGATVYKPKDTGNGANANILPMRSGTPAANKTQIPNLIRISSNSFSIPGPGITSRASAVNSTAASFNKRSVTPARWNSHLLMPLNTPGSPTDTTPVDTFNPPDWVLVTRNGPVPFSSWDNSLADRTSNNYVVGRYAYAVYDEGGLLDANVAGYPYVSGSGNAPSVTDIGRKGVITFADMVGTGSASTIMGPASVNTLVLFRNYATTDSAQNLGDSIAFASSSICNTVLGGGHGFLNYYLGADGTQGCASTTEKGTTVDFGQVNKITSTAVSPRTDQNFVTRQELIKFRSSALGPKSTTADILQYLGTFSRNQNKPTWPLMQSTPLLFPARFWMAELNNVAAYSNDFGLHNVGGVWQYWGAGGTAIAGAIPAINFNGTIDFFQLLNYALHPTWDTTTSDASDLATTLAVGAALIDQSDNDSATMRIDYSGGSVYGMEKNDAARPAGAPLPPATYYGVNRPFRNVGELGYVYKQGSIRADETLDFASSTSTSTSLDAGLLDFFTFNSAITRSGIINLNTLQPTTLVAILNSTIGDETTTPVKTVFTGGPTLYATAVANDIVAEIQNNASGHGPALSRADVARFVGMQNRALYAGDPKSDLTKEAVARALAEVGQTRTWGLLIDVVAQTGHYAPTAASASTPLAAFVVDGEKRYWMHVAIDRFDRTVLGQQLEEVFEQ